jgi:uncharacterized protein
MKLHLAQAAGNQLITGYDERWVEINQVRHSKSLIVLPDRIITDWKVPDFDGLTMIHFEQLALLKPEVVLLGTGAIQQFIQPSLGRALTEAGIGIECMSTTAACRTYNFLMAESRRVAAALIIQP